MKCDPIYESVAFSAKGQIVIPVGIRRAYQIETGTLALVQPTDEGILLKPITKHAIRQMHGALRSKPGDKTLIAEWREHKRAEAQKENPERGRRGSR